MPRFYFDITDADGIAVDEEGLDLPALEAAEIEAASSLADLTNDAAEVSRAIFDRGSDARQTSFQSDLSGLCLLYTSPSPRD